MTGPKRRNGQAESFPTMNTTRPETEAYALRTIEGTINGHSRRVGALQGQAEFGPPQAA